MKRLTLAVLIDAFGHDLLQEHEFLPELADRRPLRTVLGFSSAAIPTLLTGRWPDEHGRWFLYRRAPESSPFGFARYLAPFEKVPVLGRRVRRVFEDSFAVQCPLTEYYHLYGIPLRHLPQFDLPGRRSIYGTHAIDGVENLFDRLESKRIPHRIWTWSTPEEENFRSLVDTVKQGDHSFLFLYAPVLDGVMHGTGTQSDETADTMRRNEEGIREAVRAARRSYDEVVLYVFSDHGMVDTQRVIDVMGRIRALPFREGEDYLPFYDSTFARFWFFDKQAEKAILTELVTIDGGRLLNEDDLRKQHVWYPNGDYGNAIYLADAGTVIAPSFMGEKAPLAMHGYHPDDKGSSGMLLASREVAPEVRGIVDMAAFLEGEAGWAYQGEKHGAIS